MRVRTVVCCLATLTIVASTTPAIAGSTAPAKPRSPEPVRITKADSGRVRLIQPRPGSPIARPAGVPAGAKPAAVAQAHLAEQAGVLGISVGDLRPQPVRRVAGNDVVRFQQTIGGVPVFAGQLVTVLDRDGNLELVTGETIAQPGKAFPKVSAATANQLAATAKRAVIAREHLTAKTKLTVKPTERQWYVPELIGAPAPSARTPRPVQTFEVTGPEVSYLVLVDVTTKRAELLSSQRRHALNRVICDHANVPDPQGWCYSEEDPPVYTRTEGQAPTGITDVDLAYDYLGDASASFQNHLGIDVTTMTGSTFSDGLGWTIRATVRTCLEAYPQCPWRDSYYLGGGMVVLGEGMVTDDLVGHELAHGVTEQLSWLHSDYQSGSIDEGLSDFWGEVIDLQNNSTDDTPENRWKLGEGSAVGVVRDAEDPTAYGQPDRMTSPLWNVAGHGYSHEPAVHANAGVFSKTAFLVSDGGTFNGYTVQGIGLDKTAAAVGAMEQLLTSGADYKDVFSLLPVACRQQIGRPVGMTEADCAEVDKAVRATELYKDPLQGAPKKVTYCDTGLTNHRYRVGFESSAEGWVYGVNPETLNGWVRALEAAGPVADGESAAYASVYTPGSNWALAKREAIVLPARAFLRFEHSYFQQDESSGLLVEYLVTGGTWTPASTLPNVNGETVARSVLGGKKSFGNESYGYGSTRYDLSSLAGKSVRFRFRAATSGGNAEWWVDNLSVYTC